MENGGRLPSTSSVSSISMLEVKAETRLVLQAFLHRAAAIPLKERPGRVGGAYRDQNKYRIPIREQTKDRFKPKAKEGWDSQAEEVSSADEKSKNGFMGFMKKLPRRTQRPSRDTIRSKFTLSKDQDDELASPLSTSDEEDAEKKKKLSRKKIKQSLSRFFKKKLEKETGKETEKEKQKEKEKEKQKEKEKDQEPSPAPSRPSTLPIIPQSPQTPPPLISPSHPPEFYDDVAERLEQIAFRTTSIKIQSPEASPVNDKEDIVQRLVHLIAQEGDAINNKIELDPCLRSKLTCMSYGSFAHLLDAVSSSEVCEAIAPAPTASPTLRRIAITMEVSRHIVTATGAQRMQGFAERYMETFTPWVKSQGGWVWLLTLGM